MFPLLLVGMALIRTNRNKKILAEKFFPLYTKAPHTKRGFFLGKTYASVNKIL